MLPNVVELLLVNDRTSWPDTNAANVIVALASVVLSTSLTLIESLMTLLVAFRVAQRARASQLRRVSDGGDVNRANDCVGAGIAIVNDKRHAACSCSGCVARVSRTSPHEGQLAIAKEWPPILAKSVSTPRRCCSRSRCHPCSSYRVANDNASSPETYVVNVTVALVNASLSESLTVMLPLITLGPAFSM